MPISELEAHLRRPGSAGGGVRKSAPVDSPATPPAKRPSSDKGSRAEQEASLRSRTPTLRASDPGSPGFVNADATSTTRRPVSPRDKDRSRSKRTVQRAKAAENRSDGQIHYRASHGQDVPRGAGDAQLQELPAPS